MTVVQRTSLLTAVGMFGNDVLFSPVPRRPSGTDDLGWLWLWLASLCAMPTRGVGVATVAHGDDDVDEMTVFGDVGAEPALGTWNLAADMLRSWGLEQKKNVSISIVVKS